MMKSALCALLVLLSTTAVAADVERTHPAPGLGSYDVPFYPGATYREDVRSPDDFLGYPLGSRPATHPEIVAYFKYLSDGFPNAQLHKYAETYEGRDLVYLTITSEANAARLNEIKELRSRLSDPRDLGSESEAARIIKSVPAVAWMGYGIHGDELSSCDAALQLAYQLLAGTDEDSRSIRENLIVAIDPVQNADGRTRWLAQLDQWNSASPNYDTQSMQHTGLWPYGRTNHYLFDLNRDWFALVHPETRGRTAALLEWMPQYALDCHEMGPTSTYLFSPPREPFNPYMTDYIRKWWDRVGSDHADAFDRYGWAYYTREWNEEFYPGYGSSWPVYLGAVGMLFEQAGVDGSQIMRPEGTVMTYRETVHHQFIASMANLLTIADGREEILSDYYRVKLANVRSRESAFLFVPIADKSRMDRFVERLQAQHIEVEQATQSFRLSRVQSPSGETVRNYSFPSGTVIVKTNQPLKQLIDVILSFDIRIPSSFLEVEKKEILKNHDSKLYDATGWSLPLAYGLDAYYAESAPRVATANATTGPASSGVSGADSPVGFVFDCADECSYHLLVRLLEEGIKVRSSRIPFTNQGRVFTRGSFQVRLSDNPELDVEALDELARANGVSVVGIAGGMNYGDYADMGGEEFALLKEPRIAIVGGNPITYYDFGAIWHLLDSRYQVRCSSLNLAQISSMDLDKYNVLILPNNWGGPSSYKKLLGESGLNRIKTWVRGGGTLIAEGTAAALLADSSSGFSSVRLRRQSLKKLDSFDRVLAEERISNNPEIDSLGIWEGKSPDTEEQGPKAESREYALVKSMDEKARRLFPRGTILSVVLDRGHWLTTGVGETVPVMFNSSYAYLTGGDVRAVGRIAPANRMRLSGLLWEEARERWGDTAYLTQESEGKGQIILFATLPNFRGYFYGAERLLLNAMFLGPGFGTSVPTPW